MDLFKKIRDKYPLIEENGNMFKLLLILRSRSRTLFGKLTSYMFFDIAEYLFFDEYAAEKLYLVKLYNICLKKGNNKLAPLTIKDALSIPIDRFLYVTSVDDDGKITRLDLQSTFSFLDLPSNRANYVKRALIYIDQPRIPASNTFPDLSNWDVSTWRRIQIITFPSRTQESPTRSATNMSRLTMRIYKHTRRRIIQNIIQSLESILDIQKETKPKKRKFSPCRKHKKNYKRYNSIIKGRYRK